MLNDRSDEIAFAGDTVDTKGARADAPGGWKVAIVDDDEEIHRVTRLALSDFTFAGRPLEFLSAYSGVEGQALIRANPDAAMVLLDVVMETDHAGLTLARSIREDLNNPHIRIVLRTGQPGQAPEREVITAFDINDYKEKTELTSQKLYTLMHAVLRSYRDIRALEASRIGLERVIGASAHIFEAQSMGQFSQGVLEQIASVTHLDRGVVYCEGRGVAAEHDRESLKIIAGTGAFSDLVGDDGRSVLPAEVVGRLDDAIEDGIEKHGGDFYTRVFRNPAGGENVIYVDGVDTREGVGRHLLNLFGHNVGIAFENLLLREDIENTQKEIVYRLSEAVETRSRETGNHVRRVAEYSHLLALGAGLSEDDAETVRHAAPLHDVGKIGIPDSILNKPGKLDAAEWSVMKSHASLGLDILKTSGRRILQAGALIAGQHHEKWDGSGYPHGKGGEDIHLYGRIVALADVFDALGSDRCYKAAWPMDKTLDLLREQRGVHFDPALVDHFFANLDKVEAIRTTYTDVNLEA